MTPSCTGEEGLRSPCPQRHPSRPPLNSAPSLGLGYLSCSFCLLGASTHPSSASELPGPSAGCRGRGGGGLGYWRPSAFMLVGLACTRVVFVRLACDSPPPRGQPWARVSTCTPLRPLTTGSRVTHACLVFSAAFSEHTGPCGPGEGGVQSWGLGARGEAGGGGLGPGPPCLHSDCLPLPTGSSQPPATTSC